MALIVKNTFTFMLIVLHNSPKNIKFAVVIYILSVNLNQA